MKGFWGKLDKPFFVMAPMADVTDAAFRRIFAKYGKPDVTWTEFVSADGLFLAPEDGMKEIWVPDDLRAKAEQHGIAPNNPLLKDLMYTEEERPIVAQFFSRDPERMRRAAAFAVDLGFDGVDINMGCPAKVIVGQGAGCAMIREPEVARAVIRATKEGADGKIPVTVKTRIGFNRDELDTWLPEVLAEDPVVVTLHARTRKDMSKVSAKWETIMRAVEIRDKLGSDALIVGNGDVETLEEGRERAKETGCDGIMIGRGIFGNPWLFSEHTPTLEVKLRVMVEHAKLFEELLGDSKNFYIMKKHFKTYVSGFEGAKELRVELMGCETANEVEAVTSNYITKVY